MGQPVEVITTTADPARAQSIQRRWWLGLAIVAACAIALRCVDIGFSFDGDEAFSVGLASDSWSGVIARSLADKPHPPLHNILLHFWLLLWGVSETSARALSVLMSTASVVIVMSMLRGHVRTIVAITAGLVVAVSGFLIFYGQQARPYALIALVGSLNLIAFQQLLAAPGEPRRVWAWAGTAVLVAYTHYVGSLFLFVQGCLLLHRLKWTSWLRIIGPGVIGAATVLPWMWVAFRDSVSIDMIDWIQRPDLRTLALFYIRAIGRPAFISGWILLIILFSVAALGAWRTLQSNRDKEDVLVFAALAFAPTALGFGLSQVLDISIWAPRQFILSGLAFIALLATLVDSLGPRARGVACVALVAWAAVGASEGFGSSLKPGWRQIVDRIETADAHAAIVTEENWTAIPLQYYARTATVWSVQPSSTPVMQTRAFYFVCRPQYCQHLADLEREVGPAVEIARDIRGGDPGRPVVTYRLPAGPVGLTRIAETVPAMVNRLAYASE